MRKSEERMSARRQKVDERDVQGATEEALEGSRFLLEAHLEKATPCTRNKKEEKRPKAEWGGGGGERERERTGPMSGPVASDARLHSPPPPLLLAASFRATLSHGDRA